MLQIIKKIYRYCAVFTLAFAMFFSGFPSQDMIDFVTQKIEDRNVVDLLYIATQEKGNLVDRHIGHLLQPEVERANAATFQIQTGYYVGNGVDNRQITKVGFQPQMVIVKDFDAGGSEGMVVKTSTMTGELSLAWAETDGNLTTNHIQSFNSDGFTVGNDSDVNANTTIYYWVAFRGSDCNSSGTFCVGSYTGNGTSQNITSVGFQPDFVSVKRAGGSIGVFKTSVHSGTVSSQWGGADIASGAIDSILSNGFSIGSNAAVNTAANTYHYFAFKNTPGAFKAGSFVGNGLDNNNIDSSDDTALTFQPDFVVAKGAGATNGFLNFRASYGDFTMPSTDAAGSANIIQRLFSTGGFQVGSSTSGVNVNGVTTYYGVFGGAPEPAFDTSGRFRMINGSYTGTGAAFSVAGLPFNPDLVIVKHRDQATDQAAVWAHRGIGQNSTGYFALALSNFTGGVTALGTNSFSVGTSPTVNTAGDTYYWTAFGNASQSDGVGTASDFLIGAYSGNVQDNRNIDRLPFQPDFVTIKSLSNNFSPWRTSSMVEDISNLFNAGASTSNLIQAFNSDGFQIGSANAANVNAIRIPYFMFGGNSCTEDGTFCVGTYTGNGTVRNITSLGFQPDLVWIKKRTGGTARGALLRTSVQTGDSTSQFLALPSITNQITNLISNGFSLGTGVDSNENTFTYDFAAWNAKRYTQATYRFFENVDTQDVGSVLAAQDTPATLSSTNQVFRLRMNIRNDFGNLFVDGKNFKLQYVDKGTGTCASPSGGTPAVYTDVTSVTSIAFQDNPTPADDAALTPNANDPTDGGRTIVNQSYVESNPFTNNQASITNQSQSGKWDFALRDNGANPETTFCFRVVGATSGTLFDTYTNYPEITTAAAGGVQEISMTISDNSIGFGSLSPSSARYATGDTLGSGTDSSDAHTVTASTNASGGYILTVNGTTLTCNACSGATINSIGGTSAASSPGTEQFGIRAVVNSGTGTVSVPYNQASEFAFDAAAFPDQIATGSGDNTPTEYGVRYLSNITSLTEAGVYNGILTYTVTASY